METDEVLFERVQGGDITAFDRLYERYEVRLFAYLRALLGNRQDAEEVFHDAFLAALKAARADAIGGEGGFRAWVYRVARNLALNRRRASGRRDRHVEQAALEAQETGDRDDADAGRALEARELDAALAAAVGRLPPALGELYHLRTSGLSYEQIAGIVDAPLGTVKSRMHQMVHALREELKPWIAPQ
jgi:RNA polymerase sigma-70 factor, ECF subfamily